MKYAEYIKDLREQWGVDYNDNRCVVGRKKGCDGVSTEEEDIELFERLNERIRDLEDENYTLREELKGLVDDDVQYMCVHNRLNCFEDIGEYIPVSHIGDSLSRKTIIELQTGDEDLNVKIAELICILLNEGYFK